MPDNFLFSRTELEELLRQRQATMLAEIDSTQSDQLLQADAIEWAAALSASYQLSGATIKPSGLWMDHPEEIQVDVRFTGERDRDIRDMSRPALVPGHRVTIHVPFEGDSQYFELRPSTRTFAPPSGEVEASDLVLTIEYPDDSPLDIRSIADRFVRDVEQWLGFQGQDLVRFNNGLMDVAVKAIQARQHRVKGHSKRLEQTGIPIGRPSDDGKLVIVDTIVRRPSPTTPMSGLPVELEPAMEDAIYSHVLDVISQCGEAMSAAPGTYRQKSEEDRRQTLLAALHTHYRGKTTAEAFNAEGKTDLLIKHEGRNLFIGECKIWTGARAFDEAIDQVFGYSAWRDVKLCLVVFVDNRDLSSVIANAVNMIEQRDGFREWATRNQTDVRCRMSWPGDSSRVVMLTTIFIHTPMPPQ